MGTEGNWFSRPVNPSLGVFEIKGVRIGLLICYDIRFPELSRKLCLEKGCDVVVHPCSWSKDGSYPSWPTFVMARAMENQVYWVSPNHAGKHFGGSMICPPWVDGTPGREL